MRFEFDRPI